MNKVLVTAALLYANGPLHFGHIAGCYLPADCYSRFKRLKGCDVLYISGSDEFGVAITLSAELAKKTPREHVDHFHQINQDIFKRLEISFDHYSRTTWPGHVEATQSFFLDLLNNGHIQEKETMQLFSPEENRFLADRYVTGTCPKCGYEEARGDECPSCGGSYEATDLKNPRSKMGGSELILKKTKHWFLRFDHFKEKLRHFLGEKEWKNNVSSFAAHYVDELRERAITRDSNWGIPLPLEGTEGKVFYVWFDAPIGYISATKEWAQKINQPEKWKDFWFDKETKLVQFVGKDNIPFHAIFFPAMIMGQNSPYKLIDELPANEFYNLEGKQFSKSSGWTIDLEEFFQHFSSDQIRYAIGANSPETQDSEFTWKDFQMRCNSELVGKLGNLVNRVLTFAHNKCEGKVPPQGTLKQCDEEFLENLKKLQEEASFAFEGFRLRRACQILMELCQLGNVYFDAQKPWATAKDPATAGEMQTTIHCCLQALAHIAVVAAPIIPATSAAIWKMLGQKGPLTSWEFEFLGEGTQLGTAHILFSKVEDAFIEEQEAKLKGSHTPLKETIQFDDFGKLDLRVAKILTAEKIAKSDKLLKLSVDLGFEKRTVVSGIALQFPDPEKLIGRKVLLVANLKPAKLMGVKSEGMILAASLKEGLELPCLEHAEPGETVS